MTKTLSALTFALLLTCVAACSSNSGDVLNSSLRTNNGFTSNARQRQDVTASPTTSSEPFPIPTESILPYPSFPLHNHALTATEASKLIDPSMSPATVANLTSILTGMTLTDFDPNATINQFEIAVIDGSTNTIAFNRPKDSLKKTH